MALLAEHLLKPLPADRQIETGPFLEAVAHLPPFFDEPHHSLSSIAPNIPYYCTTDMLHQPPAPRNAFILGFIFLHKGCNLSPAFCFVGTLPVPYPASSFGDFAGQHQPPGQSPGEAYTRAEP
ncbi:hypothetical protein ACRRTK_008876 [Alexandromys fortis]